MRGMWLNMRLKGDYYRFRIVRNFFKYCNAVIIFVKRTHKRFAVELYGMAWYTAYVA